MNLRNSLLALVVIAFMAGAASANVSLRNGNFFIGYTDIEYPGGFEPKIERVYNSKTPYRSIFGWGWGFEYSAYLTVSADGSIVAHEYGGGAENVFAPETISREDIELAAETIVRAAKESGRVINPADVDNLRHRLVTDATFRNDEWEKYKSLGLLSRRELPLGATVYSTRFSRQSIKRIPEGYVRTFDNGRVETFDREGRLIRVSDKNNNFIQLSYDDKGELRSIVDNFGRKILLTVNTKGLLEKLVGDRGQTAVFRYNDDNELIYSKDVDGNTYTFGYDDRHHHNMTQVGYSDKTTLQIDYYPGSLLENVHRVHDRDGTLTTYSYTWAHTDKDDMTIGVVVTNSDNHEVSKSSYRYVVRHNLQGIEWTQRMVTDLDGDVTDTTYQELGDLPIVIKRGSEETRFEYDNAGHVTRKETPTEITELKYHPQIHKVVWTQVTSKSSGNKTSAKFDYDDRGNLTHAENSDGELVNLEYDQFGRIAAMIDRAHTRIEFTYNQNSKPTEIRRVMGGKTEKITVTYKDDGEIEKVDSTEGTKIALAITTAFQHLQDLIRPAGVSLSF